MSTLKLAILGSVLLTIIVLSDSALPDKLGVSNTSDLVVGDDFLFQTKKSVKLNVIIEGLSNKIVSYSVYMISNKQEESTNDLLTTGLIQSTEVLGTVVQVPAHITSMKVVVKDRTRVREVQFQLQDEPIFSTVSFY